MNQRPYLRFWNVGKTYGSVTAVRSVTLDIARGEFVTFLGPSGSGKSTTLYMLAGLEQPSSGDILLDGDSLVGVPPNKRNIGMVFQRYTLFPHLTVGENIAFPVRVRGRSQAEVSETVRRMLQLTRLEGFEDRKPAALSGGQQQRVALARALAYNPAILLMDEPLSALDKKLREEIQFEIKRIYDQTGVTILYVTHDQEEALRLSDRIAVFSRGVIDQVGSGRDLYERPATRFVASFIGDSNFILCQILERRDGRATVDLGQGVVAADVPADPTAASGQHGVLMIRPERAVLSARPRLDAVCLSARIDAATFLGNTIQVLLTIENQTVAVRLPVDADASLLAPGGQPYLSFSPHEALVFAT